MKEVVGLEGLKGQQIRKASSALLKHVAKQQAAADQLLADDEIIYLVRGYYVYWVTRMLFLLFKPCAISP
jgi:hypothetical protein